MRKSRFDIINPVIKRWIKTLRGKNFIIKNCDVTLRRVRKMNLGRPCHSQGRVTGRAVVNGALSLTLSLSRVWLRLMGVSDRSPPYRASIPTPSAARAADMRSAAKGRRKSFCRLPCPQPNSVLTPSTARKRAVLRFAPPPIGVTSVARAVHAAGMTAPKE